jgi:5-(carboxyamino)imidazole ribonucleotide synthase
MRGDIDEAWAALGAAGLIYEKFQAFPARCPSSACVRRRRHRVLSAVRNTHGGGILRYSIAPFTECAARAQRQIYLKRVMNALAYIGVLTIEFFVVEGPADRQ